MSEDNQIPVEELRQLFEESVRIQWPNLDDEDVASAVRILFDESGDDLSTFENRLLKAQEYRETIETMTKLRAILEK